MVENVQCPVCTLFLHAGMNLSDHLETHPKEQVIKALVQLTISGASVNNSLAAAALPEEKKPEIDAPIGPDKVTDLSNNNVAQNLSTTSAQEQKQTQNVEPNVESSSSNSCTSNKNHRSSSSAPSGAASCGGEVWRAVFNQQTASATTQAYQIVSGSNTEITTTAAAVAATAATPTAPVMANVADATPAMPTDYSAFANNERYQQHQQQNASLLHPHAHVAHRHAVNNTLPPPPPPPLPMQQQLMQLPNSFQALQHGQQQPTFLTTTTTTSASHQLQHLQHVQPQNQQQQQQQQHIRQQPTQSIKTIYSSRVTSQQQQQQEQPPLQLFSYQTPTQPQHQKPPPAYGTAISQIRSQHNQNKQHTLPPQQQQQQQHVRFTTTAVQAATSNASATKHQLQVKSATEQQHMQSASAAASAILPTNLVNVSQQQTKYLHDLMLQQQQFVANVAHSHQKNVTLSTAGATGAAAVAAGTTTTQQPPLFLQQQQTQSTSVLTSSSSSSSTTTGLQNHSRHTNSPYSSSVFPAAAPSPSSVLRYAESPVAHYLERENGDFIVQETPKHVVECVETDSGEFSVIERIYQSPPSVLHIHDDDEGDVDDDDNDEDEQKEKLQAELAAEKSEKRAPQPESDAELSRKTTLHKSSCNEHEKFFMDVEKRREQEKAMAHKSKKEASSGKHATAAATATPETSPNPAASTSCNSNFNSNSNSSYSGTLTPSSTNFGSNSNLTSTCYSNSNAKSPNSSNTGRKSSKNSVTVLSDVQLDLKEYLDLVGNIIASSKMAAKRAKFQGTVTPLPQVKIEKEEPPDDYEMQALDEFPTGEEEQLPLLQQAEHEHEHIPSAADVAVEEVVDTTALPVTITTTTKANKNETDELVETNNCSKIANSLSVEPENENEPQKEQFDEATATKMEVDEESTQQQPQTQQQHVAATCSSHVTSVIRMATTSQQQLQQQKPLHEFGGSAAERFGIVADVAIERQKESVAQDLSQPLLKVELEVVHTEAAEELQQQKQAQPKLQQSQLEQPQQQQQAPTLPAVKRGPKKLVIKPKSNKTDTNANSNNNNNNSIAGTKTLTSGIYVIDEIPTTSANAQLQRTQQKEHKRQEKQQQQQESPTLLTHATIKSEPNVLTYDSSHVYSNNSCSSSILEQHLKSKPLPLPEAPQDKKQPADVVCKKELPFVHKQEPTLASPTLQAPQPATTHVNVDDEERATPILKIEVQPTEFLDMKINALELGAKHENVADDAARVLLDFAASSKKHVASSSPANFLSSTSIFSTVAAEATTAGSAAPNNGSALAATYSTSLRCEDEFNAADDADVVQEIVISSSYSSQSASDVVVNCSSSMTNVTNDSLTHNQQQQQHPQQQHYQQQSQQSQQHEQQTHSFNDYTFSFLYGSSNVAQQVEVKADSFSPIYAQAQDTGTTAATLASGSNSIAVDDSSSSVHKQQHSQQQRFDSSAPISHWYHHASSAANSDFEAALAVDCSAAVDGCGDVVGKYLDLDACKREGIGGSVQVALSSTSSSFTAATESSLAGGCTTDGLNIRTDEKMPAKGEISEQESNCDVENSWSQPMYGDVPTRFFKTSFPSIFQQENNGWNHDEYFTIQYLNTAGNAATTSGSASAGNSNNNNGNSKPIKSFDFRLPLEATTSATTNHTTNNNNSQLFSQHADALPSTSASTSSKKKRKRYAAAGAAKTTINRALPTSTITSQQLLLHQQQQQFNLPIQQQLQQQQQQQHQQMHSAALMAGPSTSAPVAGVSVAGGSSSSRGGMGAAGGEGAGSAIAAKNMRKRIYQCALCMAEFPKLRDRNSHMIDEHNYVRQNRRLVSMLCAVARPTNGGNLANSAPSAASGSTPADFIEDSKQGIVKIEVEPAEAPQTALTLASGVAPKTEVIDEKCGVDLLSEDTKKNASAIVPNSNPEVDATTNDTAAACAVDTKPNFQQPLAISTPATKLATLYRMLVSFNISTLKQNKQLTEFEEKNIENSIFFCYICRNNFTSVKLYDAHLTEHPAECFTCGKKFQRWKNFSLHLKRHLGWKEFGCNVCDKKFVVRSALVEHMRMHTGQTPLKCKVCGKNFKRYSNLTQHRKRHGKQIIRKKEYVCHCGEVLPSKARFLWHKETHDAKPKCCPYCCDRFVHANSLRRHIRLAHSDKFDYTEPMECPMCKQIFAKSSIKAHMATHSMDTQHDCAICNKSFSTKWNLKIHSWVHANRTAKPFKCEHCPKAFVREVDFKNHINAHKQIKPYTCEYCGCKFIRKYNYMRHRREHHGNKKFTCDLCKKSFHRHYYLIEHRRIHTGERPFVCTICGKSSTTKTNHNKHLKIHHSRDPFTVEA